MQQITRQTEHGPKELQILLIGPPASGKGTIAAKITKPLGVGRVDCGLEYRIETWLKLHPHEPLPEEHVLRSEELGKETANLAKDPAWCQKVIARCRQRGRDAGNRFVADGREPHIFPEAIVVFVTANVATRGLRRAEQLHADPERITTLMAEREALDYGRIQSEPPSGCILIDTTGKTVEESVSEILAQLHAQGIISLPESAIAAE
jgi:cytidylate kinase